jgi:hypothetical protein
LTNYFINNNLLLLYKMKPYHVKHRRSRSKHRRSRSKHRRSRSLKGGTLAGDIKRDIGFRLGLTRPENLSSPIRNLPDDIREVISRNMDIISRREDMEFMRPYLAWYGKWLFINMIQRQDYGPTVIATLIMLEPRVGAYFYIRPNIFAIQSAIQWKDIPTNIKILLTKICIGFIRWLLWKGLRRAPTIGLFNEYAYINPKDINDAFMTEYHNLTRLNELETLY